jgi:toxin secretion/phage lysis holin
MQVLERLFDMWTYATSGQAPIEAILLISLVIAMCADVATGWAAAFINGAVSSKASTKGILKKAMTLIVVATVMSFIPLLVLLPVDPITIVAPVMIWFIGTELLSIVENLARAGVVNPVLNKFVKSFRDSQINPNTTTTVTTVEFHDK